LRRAEASKPFERLPVSACVTMNASRINCLKNTDFGGLFGKSTSMLELISRLARIAPSDLSLLIEGETGTGKELVAESVHRESARAAGPFVVFDCSAIAPTLVESELFGHERGAFTGAVNKHAGVFERAHGGTLMIDELGELPKDLQPKLLRVLEKREVRRLGGTRTIPIDIRLIAATNRNLRAEVQRGAFREDLYFRVAGAHVVVPPLRERLDDLELLVARFLAEAAPGLTLDDVPAEAWETFRRHSWPGNVRELKSAVQRMLVTPERTLDASAHAPEPEPALDEPAPSSIELRALPVARREAIERFEREYLRVLLRKAGGSVTVAAALAQVSRQAIHKLLAKHQ
jgi:transcriptional regulator with GAF, ATPase, and Fis domain